MGLSDYYPNSAPYNALPPSVGSIVPFSFWSAPIIRAKDGTLSCPGYSGPTYANNSYDFVVIGDYTTPGICEVVPSKARAHQVKKGKGTDGANLTFHGLELAEVDIRITIWTPEQLRALNALWLKIFPGPTKAPPSKGKPYPPPWSVYHPDLALHQISDLYFVSASGTTPGGVKGSRVFSIKCREFRKPGMNDSTSTAAGAVRALPSTLETSFALPGTNAKNTGP